MRQAVINEGKTPAQQSSAAAQLARQAAQPATPHTGHCACGGGCPRCQQKKALQPHLSISQPSDRFEQEADRVAAHVMAAPQLNAPVQVQRFSHEGASAAHAVPDSVERTLAGNGRPLETGVRNSMEQRFGHSFADVKLHLDGHAQQSAADIGADAYAVGRDVVFAAGQYAPHSQTGQHLLAHELTHVLQQTGATGAQRTVARYRAKNNPDTIAFEGADETLTDSKTQPWVEQIDVNFTRTARDTGHEAEAKTRGDSERPRLPKGTLTAHYKNTPNHPGDLSIPVAGGSTMSGIGLTDKVNKIKVSRLEGSGYTDAKAIQAGVLTDPVAKTGKGARYSKSGAGTMNYAIFFKGIQAIHQGELNTGSHACIHVEDADKLRTLNHHTWAGHTKVTVTYSDAVLTDLCCTRKRNGNPTWNGNPCNGTTCP